MIPILQIFSNAIFPERRKNASSNWATLCQSGLIFVPKMSQITLTLIQFIYFRQIQGWFSLVRLLLLSLKSVIVCTYLSKSGNGLVKHFFEINLW